MSTIPICYTIPTSSHPFPAHPNHIRDRHSWLPFPQLPPGVLILPQRSLSPHKLRDAAGERSEIFRIHIRRHDARQSAPDGDQRGRVRDEQDGNGFGTRLGVGGGDDAA